jgi:hypothetical protein
MAHGNVSLESVSIRRNGSVALANLSRAKRNDALAITSDLQDLGAMLWSLVRGDL